jgi:hypothetical protein
VAGTPCFIAPEQLRGAPPTEATDWYAFGVILYLLLTGRLPFAGPDTDDLLVQQRRDPPPPGAHTSGIPTQLEALCVQLLARDPALRPTGEAVRATLARSVPAPSRAARARRDSAADLFVGRTNEIALLHDSLARVPAHGLQCVLLAGPSGMGKSTLAARFAIELGRDQPEATGPLVLLARCHDREGLAYQALGGIIDGLYRHLDEVAAEQRPALAPRDVGLLARLFPVLARLPEHEHADQSELAASVELRTLAVEALRALLGAESPARQASLAGVYRRGLEEVGALLTGVRTQPG